MNVAFLDHSLHFKTTQSTRFFIALLEEWFGAVVVIDLARLWDEIPKRRWDLIVVFQHQYPVEVLEALGCDNIVLVPMIDDCPLEPGYWRKYQKFKVLCFSRTLAKVVESCCPESLTVTYRPPVPATQVGFQNGLRGFFWPRTHRLDWNHIGPLAAPFAWRAFHLHAANVPPGALLPGPDDLPPGVLVTTSWFERPEDYAAALAEANVFFSPRRHEGIGMAVLEALALGQCVVAPDHPTASEYITNGTSGLLFDPDARVPLDFSGAEDLGRRARHEAIEGRRLWEASLPGLRAFLERRPTRSLTAFHPWIVLRGRGMALVRTILYSLRGPRK